jgi:hypothetical protein
MAGRRGDDDQPGSYLVIPYYPGDTGSRPLPDSVAFWTCGAIKIDGASYTGQQLVPGETVNLTVDVVNYGTVTTPTLVRFFWADPTVGFTTATIMPGLIGQVTLPLARGTLTTTEPAPWTIPDGTPAHICLLAEVTAPTDPAPSSYAAVSDRHFAQQNIYLTLAAPGDAVTMGFTAGNGGPDPAHFRVSANSVTENLTGLAPILGVEPLLTKAGLVSLGPDSIADPGSATLSLNLDSGEVRAVELTVQVPRDARPGSRVMIQLAQWDDNVNALAGLGVIIQVQ